MQVAPKPIVMPAVQALSLCFRRVVQTLVVSLALLCLAGIPAAEANQVPSSSSGTGPVTKNYPSTLTATHTYTGTPITVFAASTPLNSLGGVTSAMLSPSIAATTNATELDITANGCVNTTFRCSNRGTITIAFNKAVTNPVIHISGLGGNTGTTASMYHASLNLTSWVATGTPTLTRLNGNSNFTVTGSEIRSTTINGGTNCTAATPAGCGSVRINGTVTSVTFRVDLLMGGSGANPTATSIEGITYTVSVDEDFGDAPGGFDATAAASHIVGGVYMGTGVTADNTNTTNTGAITPSPLANATATGDTDDGVTIPTLIRGQSANIDVAVTGTGGLLQAWVDWADDGNWTTSGDQIATNAVDGGSGDADGTVNGVIRLAVNVPAGAALTETIARFRYSTTTSLGRTGLASDGEVEDYALTVRPLQNDLSLTKTVSNASPSSGASIQYVLTVNSAASPTSTVTATGITVQDTLPAGVSFVSASGTGTYNSGTGVWSVGSLAPGASASITINATVTATSGTVTNIAQITASSVSDPDSTVNNGATGEDDYASVPFTVSAALLAPVCSVGPTSQIITNGDFSSGTGPSWTSWTADAIWFGTGSAQANNDTTSGNLTQSGLSGMNFGPSASNGAVVQLTAWWRNGAPAASSNPSQMRLLVAGVEYARITTPSGATTVANITYSNGATGNLTTINEFTTLGWRINLPTTVSATGAIQFGFVAGGGVADDFEIDNVTLYTCSAQADLSLTKTVSNATPLAGNAVSYTLTVSNAATPANTASSITVQDTLPAGFTYTGASGTGTYNNTTGVWSVGSVAPGASASITINGTASGSAGTAVVNVAQISGSSLPDPDSTVNNNVTTEDDYATVTFTPGGLYNCPQGNTGTGSGFASSGTGARLEQIFWLDWTCGSTGSFPAGSVINKSWNAGDGLIITGQVTNITAALSAYTTGSYGGDILDDLYAGVNPIGLRGTNDGEDPQFRLSFSATLNGQPVTLDYVAADAESSDTANEALAATVTGGTNWSLLESSGTLNTSLAGNSFTMSDPTGAGFGTAIVSTAGLTPQIDATITQGGLQAMAFGILTPYDYSDGPLTGTSYGAARHRTIRGRSMGVSFTNEQTPYDTPNADGDVDDGVTLGTLTAGTTSTISVSVTGAGQFLNAWADINDDGDFADAGEQIATNFVDGGTGDTDGTVNGVIQFSVTPPANSGLRSSIARFRLSSTSGTASSGLGGFGEVEDYAFTIVSGTDMSVNKTSVVWNNGVDPAYRIPGNDVSYTISVANNGTGSVTNNSVFVVDRLPSTVTFFNGDANGGGAGTDPVIFTDAGSGLTFNYSTDVRFATGSTVPASFADCTYTPAAGYDPAVSFICFNPKGTMAGKSGPATPGFSLTFRSLIE